MTSRWDDLASPQGIRPVNDQVLSPGALAAIAVFKAMEHGLSALLADCASALELTGKGFKDDV